MPHLAPSPMTTPAKAGVHGLAAIPAEAWIPAFVFRPGRLAASIWCSMRHRLAGGTPMLVKLHANATTTPKTRAYIQASHASTAVNAAIHENTVRRWRNRPNVAD